MSGLRIIVTGSTGWLGQMVCNMILTDTMFQSLSIDLFATYNASNPPDWVAEDHSIKFDLKDDAITDSIISSIKPNIIIHLAAVTSPAACDKDPEEALRINSPKYLIEAVQRHVPNCLFIFTSTDLVYDGEYSPYKADVTVRPSPETVYGQTKRNFEELVMNLKNGVVLRLSNMIGPKYVYRPVGTKFMQWLYEAYCKKDFIGLRSDEIRSFVFVDDVLLVIRHAILKTIRVYELPNQTVEVNDFRIFDASNRLFNIGGPIGLSRLDLATLVAESMSGKLLVLPTPDLLSPILSSGESDNPNNWNVYATTNIESVLSSGIKNPRDVTMDITNTESTFNMTFTKPKDFVEIVIRSFQNPSTS